MAIKPALWVKWSPSLIACNVSVRLVEKPYLTTTQRGEWLGQSAYSFDAGKKALLSAGLVEDVKINLGKETGGLCAFLELTASGYRALGLEPPKQRPQNSSAEHWWYQRRIAEWYREQGFKAEIECERKGKSADVGLHKDGKLIAIEVAITPANEVRNAQADLEADFDSVLIACKNAKVKKAVEDKLDFALDAQRRRRVSVTLLSEASFMKSVRGDVVTGSTQGL